MAHLILYFFPLVSITFQGICVTEIRFRDRKSITENPTCIAVRQQSFE